MLLSQFKLVTLKEYQGRHREITKTGTSVISNADTSLVYTPFTIEATNVLPISGWTLQSLPEGYRSKAQYTFWTVTDIKPLDQVQDELSDQIQIGGEWYSIYSRKDWTENTFLLHNECIAIREDQNNSWQSDTDGGKFG